MNSSRCAPLLVVVALAASAPRAVAEDVVVLSNRRGFEAEAFGEAVGTLFRR